MSIGTHLTSSGVVNTTKCKLLSVTLSQESSGTGCVRLYDEVSAITSELVLEIYQDGDGSFQVRFEGIEMERGIYLEIYKKVDHVTVEWLPLPTET